MYADAFAGRISYRCLNLRRCSCRPDRGEALPRSDCSSAGTQLSLADRDRFLESVSGWGLRSEIFARAGAARARRHDRALPDRADAAGCSGRVRGRHVFTIVQGGSLKKAKVRDRRHRRVLKVGRRQGVEAKGRTLAFREKSRSAALKEAPPALTNPDASRGTRASYWRMLRATMECMERGHVPTPANRARVLNRSRQAVWEFDKRHPDFHEWQDRILCAVSSNKWGLVKNRAADLAIQGSPTHAEIFCRMESGHYGRGGVRDDATPPGTPVVHMNFLIPRPHLPGFRRQRRREARWRPLPWQTASSSCRDLTHRSRRPLLRQRRQRPQTFRPSESGEPSSR